MEVNREGRKNPSGSLPACHQVTKSLADELKSERSGELKKCEKYSSE